MKKIYKFFQKITQNGDVIQEVREAAIRYPNNDVVRGTQNIVQTCPTCQRIVEHLPRECPIHRIYDCPKCCAELLRFEQILFERQMAIQKEQLRWLESEHLKDIPFVKTARKIIGIRGLIKLEDTRKKFVRED